MTWTLPNCPHKGFISCTIRNSNKSFFPYILINTAYRLWFWSLLVCGSNISVWCLFAFLLCGIFLGASISNYLYPLLMCLLDCWCLYWFTQIFMLNVTDMSCKYFYSLSLTFLFCHFVVTYKMSIFYVNKISFKSPELCITLERPFVLWDYWVYLFIIVS